MIRFSPASRTFDSGRSPSGRTEFFTFPRVWNEATRGAPQICFALLPTQPESQ